MGIGYIFVIKLHSTMATKKKRGRHICIFAKCTRSFERLRELKMHINDDHASNAPSDGEVDPDPENENERTTLRNDNESRVKSTTSTTKSGPGHTETSKLSIP